MSRHAVVLIASVLILGGALVSGFAYINEGKDIPNQSDFTSDGEAAVYWGAQIRRAGGEEAYEDFKQSVEGDDLDSQHSAAHIFGGALYKEEGIAGFAVCDNNFSYGCAHEFLGRAIAEHGIQSVGAFNQNCFDTFGEDGGLTCQHGIGHGVLSFYGYTFENLRQALAVCRDLPYADPIGGCHGGVFMEYNVRTVLGDEAEPRDLNSKDPYEPCNELDEDYKRPCIYWQPQWWKQTDMLADTSKTHMFTKMGEWCSGLLGNAILTRTCYEGIGNIVMKESGFDPKSAAVLCDAASKQNTPGNVFCRAVAANHFKKNIDIEAGYAVCDALKDTHLKYCRAYARDEPREAGQLDFN
jgi:hypothetical protein